jgi:hypothetical protein
MANVKRANTSGITKTGVAIADVPDAPTIGTATAVDSSSATVTYTAATTGGTATTFTATSTPGSLTGTGSSPITVSGLTASTSYTFTVRSSNSTGNSPFSSASNSITTPVPADFESIATVYGTGSSGTVSFTSIPSTYKHLQIRGIARTDLAGNYPALSVRINGDGGASKYGYQRLYGTAATNDSLADANGAGANAFMLTVSADSLASSIFGAFVLDIVDYTDTNKNKAMKSLSGANGNGSGNAMVVAGTYYSNDTVTQIDIIAGAGQNIKTLSQFALYGIRG